MKYILTILLICILPNTVLACNCAPTFPYLNRDGKKESKQDSITRKYWMHDIAVIAKIIDSKDVTVYFDTTLTRKTYRRYLKKDKRKHYSYKEYVTEQSGKRKMREYKAVVISTLKGAISKTETVYFLSDFSNCHPYFILNENYAIGGTTMNRWEYEPPRILRLFFNKKLKRRSFGTSKCSVDYVGSTDL